MILKLGKLILNQRRPSREKLKEWGETLGVEKIKWWERKKTYKWKLLKKISPSQKMAMLFTAQKRNRNATNII